MSMHAQLPKGRLTITVDEAVLEKARQLAREKHVPVSRLVENYLRFFVEPHFYCFKCGEKFESRDTLVCPVCGWMKCPKCGACRCGLSEEAAVSAFHMRKVYEDLLAGRVK